MKLTWFLKKEIHPVMVDLQHVSNQRKNLNFYLPFEQTNTLHFFLIRCIETFIWPSHIKWCKTLYKLGNPGTVNSLTGTQNTLIEFQLVWESVWGGVADFPFLCLLRDLLIPPVENNATLSGWTPLQRFECSFFSLNVWSCTHWSPWQGSHWCRIGAE